MAFQKTDYKTYSILQAMKQGTLIAAILAALAGWYFYTKKKESENSTEMLDFPTGGIKPPPILTNQVPVQQGNGVYPITYMKFHPDVKLLQKALKVTQDGIIGPVTFKKITDMVGVFPTKDLKIESFQRLQQLIDLAKQIYK